jgi:hypothetical protein
VQHARGDAGILGHGAQGFGDFFQIPVIVAVPGDRRDLLAARLSDADPGHLEAPVFDSDPAGLFEQVLTVANAHDRRIDTGEHITHARETVDLELLHAPLRHIARQAVDTRDLAIGTKERGTAVVNPADFAIRPHDPVLRFEHLAGERAAPSALHST